MAYKFFSDEANIFECKVQIEGVNISELRPRLVIEYKDNVQCLYSGNINKDGKCVIELANLHSLFKDGDTGKVFLEFVTDNGYFKSWESEYIVERNKKITVETVVNSVVVKPKLQVEVSVPEEKIDIQQEIIKRINENNITLKRIKENNGILSDIIREILRENNITHVPKNLVTETVKILLENKKYA